MSLVVEAIDGDDGPILRLKGELDIAEAEALEAGITSAEQSNPGIITLDLRELTFMDSSGLRIIVTADERARAAGRRLRIIQGPEGVQKVFKVTLMDKRLDIVEDFPSSS